MSTLTAQFVRDIVVRLYAVNIDNANSGVKIRAISRSLRAHGAVAHQHEGRKPEDFHGTQNIEWYAGQVLAAIEDARWDHINVLRNACEKFTGVAV